MDITWEGDGVLIEQVGEYGKKVEAAAKAVMELLAQDLKNYMQENARWEDRTGDARAALDALVDVTSDAIVLYLTHGVDYGIWLELANSGRYAIIADTMIANYDKIQRALEGIFNG